jgi:DNA-binding PadR family transcriptional regulator
MAAAPPGGWEANGAEAHAEAHAAPGGWEANGAGPRAADGTNSALGAHASAAHAEAHGADGKWIRGRSAHLRGALLGLVLERPSHGGELANRLAVRLGGTWRVDSNDVYRLLSNLEDEGLICAREQRRRDKRPGTRVVYHPTELTSPALGHWIETLLPRESFRLGLHAKLAVARERDLPALRAALGQHRRECLELARTLTPGSGEPVSWPALFMDCTRDGVQQMLQTEIDWVGRTLRRIDEYAARRA